MIKLISFIVLTHFFQFNELKIKARMFLKYDDLLCQKLKENVISQFITRQNNQMNGVGYVMQMSKCISLLITHFDISVLRPP